MNKLVSIIVPVYNVEKYLERCIESLLNQTYKNIEILLIDDGSTDCSGAICDKYSKQVRVFHQANRGVSAARNIGLKYMQGDFVCFVDPDDYISPYLIEKAMDSAIKHNADIVIFDYSCIKDGKVIKEHNIQAILGRFTEEEYLEGIKHMLLFNEFPNYVWNKMYKADIWKEISFPEGYTYEDVFMSYSIIEKANILSFIPDPLYFYNQDNPLSITGKIQSLNSLNRYCAVKALQKKIDIANKLGINVEKIAVTCLKEIIETIYIDYGDLRLTEAQRGNLHSYLVAQKSYVSLLNFKTRILAWVILYREKWAKRYGKYEYQRKYSKYIASISGGKNENIIS